MKAILPLTAALVLAANGVAQAEIIRMKGGKVSRYIVRSGPLKVGSAKVTPAPMPQVTQPIPYGVAMKRVAARASDNGEPKVFDGGEGDGRQTSFSPVVLQYGAKDDGVGSQEFGTSNQPYTTSDLPSAYPKLPPYPRVGQFLYFDNGNIRTCSGALIKKGLVVTAASCVAKFGSNAYYGAYAYFPARFNGGSPYLGQDVSSVYVLSSWLDGSDPCTASKQICRDDIAVATVRVQDDGTYIGSLTGWFAFAVNGYGFVNGQAAVAQLGYSFDLNIMKRTDSTAVKMPSLINNSVIGSLLTDGSQGSPWVINFGIKPKLDGTSFGMQSAPNVVVGVTSWYGGVSSPAEKRAGASPFTSNNIQVLVDTACGVDPNAC